MGFEWRKLAIYSPRLPMTKMNFSTEEYIVATYEQLYGDDKLVSLVYIICT